MPRPFARRIAIAFAAALALAGCAGAEAEQAAAAPDPDDWSAVLDATRGQTLDWYMYTGDEAINAVVEGYVARRLADEYGITLEVIGVADTADAVNKVLAERQAGVDAGGAVDAIWINGENFVTGKQAGLWLCGYPERLPNARFVDLTDPAVRNDFGVPVDGCEAAWMRADSALVYDSARLGADDVASLAALGDWARANPGLFTYPAPPDFTGSMVVRTYLYDTADDPAVVAGPFDEAAFAPLAERLWARLEALEPALWRGGETYPTSQTAVEQLFAAGEIAAYFTYGPGTVAAKVDDGVFPATTRQAVPSVGNIGNVSNIAIPANASDPAAALVLANLLQDPETQLRFYVDAGIHPVIELDRTAPDIQQRFAAVSPGPSVLPIRELTANTLPEPEPAYITAVEDGWTTHVLQQ
ncbi:ABC transporter substrate-binding protein [Pseudonocardia nigra]|uniref:ABC transporter substrate-binding protein n=1 Tax=Pseudonocardia nigra TaxID=1921578 RepID=UPI001C607965|nr:ABC transporter substrate-binding protein [Pseudonocardia nigra]